MGPGNGSFVMAQPATLTFSHHLEDPLSVRPSRPQAAEETWGRGSRKPSPEAPSAAPGGILRATRSCARGRARPPQRPERPGLPRASASRWGLRAPIPPLPAIGAPRNCGVSTRPGARAHSRSPSPPREMLPAFYPAPPWRAPQTM
ncbi:wiskott-Aldrich syndrome protein family member 1-like [Homo sapiens]|uniref:wiskott-Aldrich syndrome protein family member 1-like n=1 Tax=Homo sapiens TaxID=9606 RepID=UPI001FB12F6E|nr:wiskott-Aldrich syndrome protein family member 1-like [Homo sapiens]